MIFGYLYTCNYLFYIYRHGIIRMEFHILNDQELSFQDIMKRHLSGEKMVNTKEKRLYEEMRLNAANAKKKLVKDEKEEVKKTEEEKQEDETSESKKDDDETSESKKDEDETSESKKDDTKEKTDEVTKEENVDSGTKQDEVKEEDKEENDTTEKVESMETEKDEIENDENEKDLLKEKSEEPKADNENQEELNKDDKEDETLKIKKLKIKFKKGKKRGPGRPPKKDNPFDEDDFDDIDGMYLEDFDDDGAPITSKGSLEKPSKRKPGRPPGRPKKQLDPFDELEGKRSTRSDLKVIPFDGCSSKGSVSLTPVKKSSDQESPLRRKGGSVNVSIDPPQISLQQMEQMARGGVYDMDMMTDLMQQTYAAAIKWPKDRILTIRLEHIMEAVETDEWPVSKEFSYAEAAQLTIPESPAATEDVPVTPMRDTTPTPARSEVSEVSNPYEDSNVLTPGRKHGNRGRKPLGASLHSPEIMDKTSKIRSLLTAGHQGRPSQVESEEIR